MLLKIAKIPILQLCKSAVTSSVRSFCNSIIVAHGFFTSTHAAYTPIESDHFLTSARVSSGMQKNFLEPLQRVIYDQALNETHAFATLVSMTSMVGADSFDGGNSRLVEKMFHASNATVSLRTTAKAIKKTVDGKFSVEVVGPQGALRAEIVDDVVLAAPIEHLNISLPEEAASAVREMPKRNFTHWYVTVVNVL